MNTETLNNSHIDALASVMMHAFSTDPVLRWIFPEDVSWPHVGQEYFRLMLKQNLSSGTGLTDTHCRGVSLWDAPDPATSAWQDIRNSLQTLMLLRSNIVRAARLQNHTRAYRPTKPHWYLTFLATDPDYQRHGVGGQLLSPILESADDEGYDIYLECSNQANIHFYVGRGFHLLGEVRVPDGPSVWPMLRSSKS